MASDVKSFPIIPVSNWTNLRQLFKKSIPGIVTPNYLASTLGVTEVSAKSNIVPSLRQVGLIDESGKTNQEMAKKFRDDEQYKEFCNLLLKKIYPDELLSAFPDKDSDSQKVRKWFMNNSGVGESGAQRLSSFYFELIKREVKKEGQKATSKSKAAPVAAKVATAKTVSSPAAVKEPEFKATHKQEGISPAIHINIQIHISSDASSDQIKSIFENMSKYVYQNNG